MKRSAMDGAQLTLSAKKDSNNAEFVNCWVPHDRSHTEFASNSQRVATTVSPAPIVK
ncbi:hypothetical protein [Halioglobus sp. HI00S01]|uniref:hypothetical protein n=1 Tax=Halioglobus sp. HI00S01 TaxID=1822214 RepID=UPI0012E93DFF|nr:hypothetical protein [Halioglobus sp. HI00S01]